LRENVGTADSKYAGVVDCATTVLSHFIATPLARSKVLALALMIHSYYTPATEAFSKRWGPDTPPTDEQILNYLSSNPPNLILACAPDLEKNLAKNAVCWGLVNKESEHNEIFIPIDLAIRLHLVSVIFYSGSPYLYFISAKRDHNAKRKTAAVVMLYGI
jgi:hypothetical protein